jgi:2-methylcitrate dehydratase PrpD
MNSAASGGRAAVKNEVIEFIETLEWKDVPAHVQEHVAWLLLDFAAVSIAGRDAPAARISADYASEAHAGEAATALIDGRRLAVPGAAWANGVLANVLDYDDGHRLTKGHPGAIVIPAALAVAEATDSTLGEFLVAVVAGYEIAIRAGICLHARETDYHASGAWGAIGAAGASARLLGFRSPQIRSAIGLAEYHAPIAHIMRSVDDPAMTKDATGWGALVGTSSSLLAKHGYTALESQFLSGTDDMELGGRWDILDLYVKPYPCCRWTHPSIAAALQLRALQRFSVHTIERVTIRTFAAAAALSRRRPRTTEEAQYCLVWPVAMALAHGGFDTEDVLRGFDDPLADSVASRVEIVVDEEMTAVFPAQRLAEVSIELSDGSSLTSAICRAGGEPGDPAWRAVVERKVRRFVELTPPSDHPTQLDTSRNLGGLSLVELERMLGSLRTTAGASDMGG